MRSHILLLSISLTLFACLGQSLSSDEDGDGVAFAYDCDDNNAESTVIAEDADCDGVLTADDCDDGDENSTIVAEDADCDGVLTADDCDDLDPNSHLDVDNDGYSTCDGDCDDSDASLNLDDPDNDGYSTCSELVYTGATTLDTKSVECSSHQFDFEFYTVGLTDGGQLQISGAGWEEDHYITSADFDPDGWWDQLLLTLPHVNPDITGDGVGDTYGSDGWKYQENNTNKGNGNTLYNCTIYTQNRLTFQLSVFDDLDKTRADCAVWGDNPGVFSDGCETWN